MTRRRTLTALAALPALAAIAETNLVHDTPASVGAHTKPTSKPPVHLDTVSDLDEAFVILRNAAELVARHSHTTPPDPYWTNICEYLIRHLPTVSDTHPTAADWARCEEHLNTAYDTVATIAITEEREWRPIPGRWTCPFPALDDDGKPISHTTIEIDDDGQARQQVQFLTCNGPLLESTTERIIRCPACKRRWEGNLEYTILGRQLGVTTTVTVAQAAALAKVSIRTIERWIKTGYVTALTLSNGQRTVSKQDLAIHAARRDA